MTNSQQLPPLLSAAEASSSPSPTTREEQGSLAGRTVNELIPSAHEFFRFDIPLLTLSNDVLYECIIKKFVDSNEWRPLYFVCKQIRALIKARNPNLKFNDVLKIIDAGEIALQSKSPSLALWYTDFLRGPPKIRALNFVAKSGNLELLKQLRKKYFWLYSLLPVMRHLPVGIPDILSYAPPSWVPSLSINWGGGDAPNASTSASAAAGGHLPVLKWLRDNNCPWDKRTCESAAAGGHLNVLQWARANGCPLSE